MGMGMGSGGLGLAGLCFEDRSRERHHISKPELFYDCQENVGFERYMSSNASDIK